MAAFNLHYGCEWFDIRCMVCLFYITTGKLPGWPLCDVYAKLFLKYKCTVHQFKLVVILLLDKKNAVYLKGEMKCTQKYITIETLCILTAYSPIQTDLNLQSRDNQRSNMFLCLCVYCQPKKNKKTSSWCSDSPWLGGIKYISYNEKFPLSKNVSRILTK